MAGHTDHTPISPLMNDGMSTYIPSVNCLNCGRFVGRDGWIDVEHYEMSHEVASVEGECRRCIDQRAVTA